MVVKLKDIKFSRLEHYPHGSKSHPRYDWDSLKKSILTNGYNPNKFGFITISSDGYCINGHHRTVILRELYDDYYEVEVIKLKSTYIKQFLINVIKDILNIKK